MEMLSKGLEYIKEDDLQELIDNSVMEAKMLEYKKELLIGTDSQKKEFLADISSFANADGGYLIFGIEENNGIPISLVGIDIENLDQMKLQIEQIIRTGIEPRLPLFEFKEVPLSNSKYALIFRIFKSWIGPHWVCHKGTHKFYIRGHNGKYEMSLDELRTAFRATSTVIEKIRALRIEKIENTILGETPVILNDGAKILLQLIPMNAFALSHNYEVWQLKAQEHYLPTIGKDENYYRFVLEGFIRFNTSGNGYVLFYRNGIVESVDAKILNINLPNKEIHSIGFERQIIETLKSYKMAIKNIGIGPPIVIFITLINIRGYKIKFDRVVSIAHDHRIADRDILKLPEVIIKDYNEKIEGILKPCFDAFWNAFNFERSPNYNENNEWTGKGHF